MVVRTEYNSDTYTEWHQATDLSSARFGSVGTALKHRQGGERSLPWWSGAARPANRAKVEGIIGCCGVVHGDSAAHVVSRFFDLTGIDSIQRFVVSPPIFRRVPISIRLSFQTEIEE